MPKYLDPICYSFHFSCLSENDHEYFVKECFYQLIQSCNQWLLPFLCSGGPKAYRISSASKNDGVLGNYIHWIGSCFHSISETEKSWNDLCGQLQDDDFFGFHLWGHEKYDLIPYSCGSSKFAREYVKWFGIHKTPPSKEEYLASQSEIYSLLNCPHDDLQSISLPISMFHGSNPLLVLCFRMPITSTMDHPYRYQTIAPYGANHAPKFLYQISMIIPRFMVKEHGSSFPSQNTWRSILLSLGNKYPLGTGAINMDCPAEWFGSGNNCYEQAARSQLGKRFFSEYISGYSWGMLISSPQARLMKDLDEDTKQRFHAVEELQNQCRYFQLTADVRNASKDECVFLRNVFRPYLPPVGIPFYRDSLPSSLRLGFSINEMHWNESEGSCIYQIRHSLAES